MSRNRITGFVGLLLTGVTMFAAETAPMYSKLPKYQTPIPYFGIRNWHVTQNLGPIGARGWVYGHKNNTKESREIIIKGVVKGSPADGILQRYDIIVGVEGKRFSGDARLAYAKAITKAESKNGGGKLRILRWRDGAVKEVTISIGVMGDYSVTAPFNCPKSKLIVKNAAANLAEHMPVKGYGGMTGAINTLFLFATEDDRYLDHVRRSAMVMGPYKTISTAGHESWRWGYCNLFLCEYYLATGDERVLPKIEEYCRKLTAGQCNPGTWGHSTVENWIPPGYGSMNQAGLICFMSMVLGRQCDVKFDEKGVVNSINFYGKFAGKGGVPYGDHPPYPNATSNGKNGSAAVAFSILGADPAAQWFGRLCASTDLKAFEGGHTGNFFNQTWTPLGAALTGASAYQKFWKRFNSYRDLARRWDGTFVSQPLPNTREGDLGTGNYTNKGPNWATGGFALSYLARNQSLAILGRRNSVFAKNPPKELTSALSLYRAKKFKECIAEADKQSKSGSARKKEMARQLVYISKRNLKSVELTLADMMENLEAGDLYTMKIQMTALQSIIDDSDLRLKPFQAVLATPQAEKLLEDGERFANVNQMSYRHNGPKGFFDFAAEPMGTHHRRVQGDIRELLKNGSPAYKETISNWRKKYPEKPKTQTLQLVKELKVDSKTKSAQQTFEITDLAGVKELSLGLDMKGALTMKLNNTLIIQESLPGGMKVGGDIILKPATLKLLKPGKNTLSIEMSGSTKGGFGKCKLNATTK